MAVTPISHGLVIVMSPDCDLFWDHQTRFNEAVSTSNSHKLMNHVILCDLFEEAEIRQTPGINSNIWNWIRGNNNERYHYFDPLNIKSTNEPLSKGLVADFKKTFAIDVGNLYQGIMQDKGVNRMAIIPPIYLQSLIQRFYSFLSRIGLPDT